MSSRNENLLLGDFNAEPTTTTVSDFCEIYNLKNIIKDKTCFKNPTWIDLMITNRPRSFKHSMVAKYFHKIYVTVMKTCYNIQKRSIVKYSKFKKFSNDAFLKDLKILSKLDNEKHVPVSSLKETTNRTLEKQASLEKRYVRGNQLPFINKTLSKEITKM